MVFQPPPWQALCLAQASSFVIASCHWSLHLIPLTWNKFTNMPLISHCFIVQKAIIISWHLSHYELWIHNGIYEFFLAYPRSNLITLFFLICQQSLIIPTALLLPSQVIDLCIKAAPFLICWSQSSSPKGQAHVTSCKRHNEPTPWIPLHSLSAKLLMQIVSPIPLTLGYLFSFHSI